MLAHTFKTMCYTEMSVLQLKSTGKDTSVKQEKRQCPDLITSTRNQNTRS